MWDPRCLGKGARTRLERRWLPPSSGKAPSYFQLLVGDGSLMQNCCWDCCLQPRGDQSCPGEWHVPMAGTGPFEGASVLDTWSHHPSAAVAGGTCVNLMPSLWKLKGLGSKDNAPPLPPPISCPPGFWTFPVSPAHSQLQHCSPAPGVQQTRDHPPASPHAAAASLPSSLRQPQRRSHLAAARAAVLQTQGQKNGGKTMVAAMMCLIGDG